jgi:hypothetical protein
MPVNLTETLQNLFAVEDTKTKKTVAEGFKDKKSAKVKRNELNKPFKTKKDSMPTHIIKKGKDHIHYD